MTYKEFEDIAIPEWLESWEDSSWHNDACPHSTYWLTADQSGNGPCIELWVNYADQADREVPPRYQVVYQKSYELESGSDILLYSGESEEIARQWARKAESGAITADGTLKE